MSETQREYRVWHENGDVIDVYGDAELAETRARNERRKCTCGEESGAKGLYCGTLHPHAIFVQAVEGDYDVTQDYLING